MENSGLLEVRNLDASYINVHALWSVSLAVGEAEIVALIGANGAGKTTLLKAISGMLAPRAGMVEFQGWRIDELSPHAIVELGVSLVPEGGKPFPDMAVRENLELGSLYQARMEASGRDPQ